MDIYGEDITSLLRLITSGWKDTSTPYRLISTSPRGSNGWEGVFPRPRLWLVKAPFSVLIIKARIALSVVDLTVSCVATDESRVSIV